MQTNLEYLEVQAKTVGKNPTWEQGLFLTYEDSHQLLIVDTGCRYEIDPTTIRRWSGQYDKNGKKIWEGDVSIHSIKGREALVIDEETVYFICYYIVELSGFCWLTADEIEEYNSTNHQDFIEVHTMNAYESHLVTVIGNVYDSPKYLEL